jgi:hypothetical protein
MTTSFTPREKAGTTASILSRLRRYILDIDARVMAGLNARHPLEGALSEAALVDGSRLVSMLWSAASALADGWRTSAVRRFAVRFNALDLQSRIEAVGCVLFAAVLAHTVTMAMAGVQVHGVGWTARVLIAVAGAGAMFRSDPVAAAWRARRTAGEGK